MTRLVFPCVLGFLLFTAVVFSQTQTALEIPIAIGGDSVQVIDEEYPWESSIFLSAGYGFPQGLRTELGWNIGQVFVIGVTFGIGDHWSSDPGEGTVGYIAGVRFPSDGMREFTPYLLVGQGTTLRFGSNDTFTLIAFGGMIPFTDGVTVRPEFLLCFTRRYDYARTSAMRGRLQRTSKTYPGVNLTLELEL